jgi:peroxiredoxin
MKIITGIFLSLIYISAVAQKQATALNTWRGVVQRQDGNEIAFNFQFRQNNRKPVLYVMNAAERIRVDSIRFAGDSVFIKMPVFESSFKAQVKNGGWDGVWIKGTSTTEQIMPFHAERNGVRYPLTTGAATTNITGRWAVHFASDKGEEPTSIAEFAHKGNKVTGTFMTPTGDYRYLEGVVTGNQLKLSGFDGGHAVLFTGNVANNKTITNGKFLSGANYSEAWIAIKSAKAKVKQDVSAMYVKPGEERLSFTFPDIDGKPVSINDNRFKNKVVVIQLMGSWCPNCMDETAFLSDYYRKNKQRGVEIIALAYEYSTDFNRSQRSLKKFQQRFKVEYPILITGVTVSDTLRTEKTLPQVTRIKVFPSSIILDKTGKIRKLDNGFSGPATGQHYEAYKKEFYATMDELLKEK